MDPNMDTVAKMVNWIAEKIAIEHSLDRATQAPEIMARLRNQTENGRWKTLPAFTVHYGSQSDMAVYHFLLDAEEILAEPVLLSTGPIIYDEPVQDGVSIPVTGDPQTTPTYLDGGYVQEYTGTVDPSPIDPIGDLGGTPIPDLPSACAGVFVSAFPSPGDYIRSWAEQIAAEQGITLAGNEIHVLTGLKNEALSTDLWYLKCYYPDLDYSTAMNEYLALAEDILLGTMDPKRGAPDPNQQPAAEAGVGGGVLAAIALVGAGLFIVANKGKVSGN